MPSLVQRARSVAASVTRSVRSAARRLGSLFTRKSATPGLRRRPTEAITVEEYIEAVPRAPSPRPRTPSPRPRTPSPPRLTVNQIALAARLRKPRINNPLPPSQVSARAPRPATVPGGIAGPGGNAARRAAVAREQERLARAAARAAAAATAAAAAEVSRQQRFSAQRARLAADPQFIEGIRSFSADEMMMTRPTIFKRIYRALTMDIFESLDPEVQAVILERGAELGLPPI